MFIRALPSVFITVLEALSVEFPEGCPVLDNFNSLLSMSLSLT